MTRDAQQLTLCQLGFSFLGSCPKGSAGFHLFGSWINVIELKTVCGFTPSTLISKLLKSRLAVPVIAFHLVGQHRRTT